MRFEFRKDIKHHYFSIIPDLSKRQLSGYKIKMILNGRIPGTAACSISEMDGETIYSYDVTGYISLKKHLETHIADAAFFRSFSASYAKTAESVSVYMLDARDIFCDPNGIFLRQDENKYKFLFICWPETNSGTSQSKALGEYLLTKMKHDDKETVNTGYRFYQAAVNGDLNINTLYELASSRFYLPRGRTDFFEDTDSVRAEPSSDGQDSFKAETDYSFLYESRPAEEKKKGESILKKLLKKIKGNSSIPKKIKPETKSPDLPVISDEKKELCEAHETVFLNRENKKPDARAWLIPVSGFESESVELQKDIYLIGRKVAGADIVFDSPALSRIHARLSWTRETYAVMDMGSRNGTYINRKLLCAGELCLLSEGDEILFGDIVFRYALAGP